jgi:hypothetical protein
MAIAMTSQKIYLSSWGTSYIIIVVVIIIMIIIPGLEDSDYSRKGSAALTTRHPSVHKSWY